MDSIQDVICISAGYGYWHSLVSTTNDKVFAWGLNIRGEDEISQQTHLVNPTFVAGTHDVQVVASESLLLAVTTNKSLWK